MHLHTWRQKQGSAQPHRTGQRQHHASHAPEPYVCRSPRRCPSSLLGPAPPWGWARSWSILRSCLPGLSGEGAAPLLLAALPRRDRSEAEGGAHIHRGLLTGPSSPTSVHIDRTDFLKSAPRKHVHLREQTGQGQTASYMTDANTAMLQPEAPMPPYSHTGEQRKKAPKPA